VTTVAGVKSTVAALLSRCVSRIVLPVTDLTRPSTWSWPTWGRGDGFGAELVGLTDAPGFPVSARFDVPHAATDSVVTATIASRVSRGWNGVADINCFSDRGFFRCVRVFPVGQVAQSTVELAIWAGTLRQLAALGKA
jgi:hypothetical protein